MFAFLIGKHNILLKSMFNHDNKNPTIIISKHDSINHTTQLIAQTDTAIDPSNLNSRYLTYLIKEGIELEKQSI